MVGWHQQLNGQFEQAPGDSEGQRSLVCCSSWGHKESDTTQQLKTTKVNYCICTRSPCKSTDTQKGRLCEDGAETGAMLSIYWVFSPSPFSFLQQSLLPTLVLCRNLPLLSLPKITLLKQQCGNPISPQGCIPLLPASPLSFFRAELQTYSQSLDKLHLFIYILVIFWDFGSARMRTLVCFHHKVSPSFWNCTQQKLSKYVCNK